MKKVIIFSTTLFFVIFIMSCQKEAINSNLPSIQINNQEPPVAKTIVSNWFKMTLVNESDMDMIFLEGFEQSPNKMDYDRNTHVELVYVKMPVRGGSSYGRLPMKFVDHVVAEPSIYTIDFSIADEGFYLTIKNTDPLGTNPDAAKFYDFQYRYIILPVEKFNSMNINWDDYTEVAIALNL